MKSEEFARQAQEKRWDEAEKTGEEVLNLNPRDKNTRTSVLWTLAQVEGISGKYTEGLEHAEMLKQIDPQSGHYLLGRLYYQMEQYDRSKEELLEAKKLGAQYADIDRLLDSIDKISNGKK